MTQTSGSGRAGDDARLPVPAARGTPGVVVRPLAGSARMEPARSGAGGAPPRPPAPGEKRRPAQCEGPPLPKLGLSEAAAAARLRALPAQHDHGYSGNGLRLPPP